MSAGCNLGRRLVLWDLATRQGRRVALVACGQQHVASRQQQRGGFPHWARPVVWRAAALQVDGRQYSHEGVGFRDQGKGLGLRPVCSPILAVLHTDVSHCAMRADSDGACAQTSPRDARASAVSDTGESDEDQDEVDEVPARTGLISKLSSRVAQGAASTAGTRAPPPPLVKKASLVSANGAGGEGGGGGGGGAGDSAIRPFEPKDAAARVLYASPANSAAAAKAIQAAPAVPERSAGPNRSVSLAVPPAADPSEDEESEEESEESAEEAVDDSEEAAEALELHKNLRWQLGMVVHDDSKSSANFSQV